MRTDSKLPLRILSAVVFLPILAWLIHEGGVPYLAYTWLLLTLAFVEFCRMGEGPVPVVPCVLAATVFGLSQAGASMMVLEMLGVGPSPRMPPLDPGIIFLVHGPLLSALSVLLWGLATRRTHDVIRISGRVALAHVYVGGLGLFLVLLRVRGPGDALLLGGAAATALAYVLTWSADTGAYAVGLLAGRRPLMPEVSPKKTWEGAIGGVGIACAAGLLGGRLLWPQLGVVNGAVLGVLVGVFGQVGDLIESLVKRSLGSKDSASWIPGHGGVLDRFDSLLLGAPVVFIYLAWLRVLPAALPHS